MDKYRLYNVTKDIYEYVISNVLPTTLPDNPLDTIDLAKTEIMVRDIKAWDVEESAIVAPLALYKSLRVNAIDRRTEELILEGHPYGGKQFAISPEAHRDTADVEIYIASAAYPIVVSTLDNTEQVSLADSTEAGAFYASMFTTKRGHIDSGNVLKNSINTAIDQTAGDLIVDNR